jgi:hypothetical protein
MPARNERIGELIQRGILLFSQFVAFPASALVAAVSAAVISKLVEIHHRRVTEVLSEQIGLKHISYLEPDPDTLLKFYRANPFYPGLADQFNPELESHDVQNLRRWYPYLYSALILKRQVPALLFHKEIEDGKYRELAENYEVLSHGYEVIQGDPDKQGQVNHFAEELWEVVQEIYEAAKDELKGKENAFAFDLIDYIREVATS